MAGSYRFDVEIKPGELVVHTDVHKCPHHHHDDVVAALYGSLGYQPPILVPLAKAAQSDGDNRDPRYPRLSTIIAEAVSYWRRWLGRLVGDVVRATDPTQTMRDAEDAAVVDFSGVGERQRRIQLRARGMAAATPKVEVAFKAGLALPPGPHRPSASVPTWGEVLLETERRTLTPQERGALDYARHRAARFMRRPAVHATGEVGRVLALHELNPIRAAVGRAVVRRQTPAQLAQSLRTAVQGNASLTNDMLRVARTELQWAHAYGAYTSLRKRAGSEDPMVFKMTSPTACSRCVEIWGPSGSPRLWRLSVVEAAVAAGGNFGRKSKDWGPTIGPTHPNCTCSPLMEHTGIDDAEIAEVAEAIASAW